MRKATFLSLVALASLALVGAGCFNGAFRGDEFGDAGGDRFELVIEADRTGVDATHFLVDRATGDLWLLDVTGRRSGAWVRLADAPADAAELGLHPALEKGDEEEN